MLDDRLGNYITEILQQILPVIVVIGPIRDPRKMSVIEEGGLAACIPKTANCIAASR